MRRRRFLGSLAGVLLLAGGASSPARADSFTFPSVSAPAKTVNGDTVGAVRVQLQFEDGSYRHGGKTWACKYTHRVEFDSLFEAYVTAFQPSACGHAYSLDNLVRGKTWNVSEWVNLSSRLLTFSTNTTSDAIGPFASGSFTGYSNAAWGVGSITVRGKVMTATGWQDWAAELTGHVMGCELRNPPAEPILNLGVSTSKNPVGTEETIGVTVTLSNTGGADAENVLLTMDGIANATYVPKSSTGNGEELPDVDGLPAVINGGILATVGSGETVTLGFDVKIPEDAGGKTLHLSAHAALKDYPTKTTTADVPIVRIKVPKLSMSLKGSPNPVDTGETLTATIELKNSGDGNAQGVVVKLDPVLSTSYLGGTTRINGVVVPDLEGSSLLASGLPVNVPAGGTTQITWSAEVAQSMSNQPLQLKANAALAGHAPLSASAEVQRKWPALSLTGWVNNNPVKTGEVLTATWELTNTGDGVARNVILKLDPVGYTTYFVGSTTVNGAQQPDEGGQSALASGLPVTVPAGGTVKVTWSGKVANNAGGQTLQVRLKTKLVGHADLSSVQSVTVVEAIPAAFETLNATINAAQAASAFRFVITGHKLFSDLARDAEAAWKAGNKKLAVQHLEKIMYYATWRGRFGLDAELFHPGAGQNWAAEINGAAQKVRNLIQAS
jgi:uncharacterized repeat protein (TIGR01451 family)